MVRFIDPATFHDKPMMLRRIGEDDYAITVGGLPAGRIMAKSISGGRVVWFWTLTGPSVPESLQPAADDAESLDEAKTAIKAKFESWLRWATGQGQEMLWHG